MLDIDIPALRRGRTAILSPCRLSLPEGLALARRTVRIVKQNLVWAFAYNFLAIPLAMAGWVARHRCGLPAPDGCLAAARSAICRRVSPFARPLRCWIASCWDGARRWGCAFRL